MMMGRLRNHRLPTEGDTPTSIPAASLERPRATAAQNRRRCSRRPTPGRPGECSTGRPVCLDAQPFGLPIATLLGQVLRRPDESTQYTSADYTQELDDHGVLASVGSVGDAYDNAMAESFVDTFKTELIASGALAPSSSWPSSNTSPGSTTTASMNPSATSLPWSSSLSASPRRSN